MGAETSRDSCPPFSSSKRSSYQHLPTPSSPSANPSSFGALDPRSPYRVRTPLLVSSKRVSRYETLSNDDTLPNNNNKKNNNHSQSQSREIVATNSPQTTALPHSSVESYSGSVSPYHSTSISVEERGIRKRRSTIKNRTSTINNTPSTSLDTTTPPPLPLIDSSTDNNNQLLASSSSNLRVENKKRNSLPLGVHPSNERVPLVVRSSLRVGQR